ncbi:MAG: hypothetical protein C4522_00260 [Desulfobacteraceae bacterium]|nr:MAG: hypothetical protein C4522_00260 [Desulfobacteraceae bacterium]
MSFPTRKKIGFLIVSAAVVLVIVIVLQNRQQQKDPANAPESITIDPDTVPHTEMVLDYGRLEEDRNLSALMEDRKGQYGIDDGLDMIVKSDESLRVGDETVKMRDIVDEGRLKRGELVERNLGKSSIRSKEDAEDFGVHVVLPGENIWNIHFQLLKNYFRRKQVSVSPLADEPGNNGRSSGVGKILKFSEKMVYIYNVKERKIASDIHQLEPLSKIVVYHMKEVFSLLETIDVTNMNRIRFDGETIWITNE